MTDGRKKHLYVVLHHRDDQQKWINDWVNENTIAAIQTTSGIGELCREAQQQKEPVFVHRCGFGELRPTICCKAYVEDVSTIDRSTALVRFHAQEVLTQIPPVTPHSGQNFYIA